MSPTNCADATLSSEKYRNRYWSSWTLAGADRLRPHRYAIGRSRSSPSKLLRCFALWGRCRTAVRRCEDRRLFCRSNFACGFECPAQKRVLRLFGQSDQPVAVEAVDLRSVANAAGFLTEHTRARGASDFDFVIHDNTLCRKGQRYRAGLRKTEEDRSIAMQCSATQRQPAIPPTRQHRRNHQLFSTMTTRARGMAAAENAEKR